MDVGKPSPEAVAVPTSAQDVSPPSPVVESVPPPIAVKTVGPILLGPPPPLPAAEAGPQVPCQVILDNGYLCGICSKRLMPLTDVIGFGEEAERIVALACTTPPSHVFHGSCLKEWRSDGELGTTCPTCTLNPISVLRRAAVSKALKAKIQKKRESCWRAFWAEWARQRNYITAIMLAVAMCLIIVRVLEEWIRGWNYERTEL